MARLAAQALLLAAVAISVVARSPTPRFPYDDNTSSYCTWWLNYEGGESCDDILDANWITIEEFRRWNPSVGAACAGMETERSYCVEAFGEPEPTAVPTPTPTPTVTPTPTTTPGNGVSTPQPIQPGMVDNCNRFYFVEADQNCADIATAHGISLTQFTTWNPNVGGATCSGLWANVNVCVGVVGFTPTSVPPTPPTTTTITSAGNGISTPQPTQPGMVTNCDRFYFVEAGDSCAEIASSNGISLSQLTTWNDVGGASCGGLWADVYVCVRVIGATPTTSSVPASTTTTPGNAVSTPVPTQPGMVGNCDRFYFVEVGDTCAEIVSRHRITLAQFTAWNNVGGSSCGGLWANVWVCVRILR